MATKKWGRGQWIVLAVVVVPLLMLFTIAAVVIVPILSHVDGGTSTVQGGGDEWPTEVVADGDDGRTRTLTVTGVDGAPVLTSALSPGDQLVVTGTGFDGAQGIYVAICVAGATPEVKPGPCIGGVPEQEGDGAAPESIEYTPSAWINDEWAWTLVGARPYDDAASGTFTAYLVVGDPAVDGIDCETTTCVLTTRNDHTAAGDRVQDVGIPVRVLP